MDSIILQVIKIYKTYKERERRVDAEIAALGGSFVSGYRKGPGRYSVDRSMMEGQLSDILQNVNDMVRRVKEKETYVAGLRMAGPTRMGTGTGTGSVPIVGGPFSTASAPAPPPPSSIPSPPPSSSIPPPPPGSIPPPPPGSITPPPPGSVPPPPPSSSIHPSSPSGPPTPPPKPAHMSPKRSSQTSPPSQVSDEQLKEGRSRLRKAPYSKQSSSAPDPKKSQYNETLVDTAQNLEQSKEELEERLRVNEIAIKTAKQTIKDKENLIQSLSDTEKSLHIQELNRQIDLLQDLRLEKERIKNDLRVSPAEDWLGGAAKRRRSKQNRRYRTNKN